MSRSLKPLGPGTAKFSACGVYRYELTRDVSKWPQTNQPRGILLSIGLNPSTATGDDDDPTIHKESFIAINQGLALYLKANAYAYRATVPDDMFKAKANGIDIVGPDNNTTIAAAIARVQREGGKVLVAWGGKIERERQIEIATMLVGVEVVCVAVNNDGSPSHPLYKKAGSLTTWSCPSFAK